MDHFHHKTRKQDAKTGPLEVAECLAFLTRLMLTEQAFSADKRAAGVPQLHGGSGSLSKD